MRAVANEAIRNSVLQVKPLHAAFENTVGCFAQPAFSLLGHGSMTACEDALLVALSIGADHGHVEAAHRRGAVRVGSAVFERRRTSCQACRESRCRVGIEIATLAVVLADIVFAGEYFLAALTAISAETFTAKPVDAVHACPTVFARVRSALVDVHLAKRATETRGATARKGKTGPARAVDALFSTGQ